MFEINILNYYVFIMKIKEKENWKRSKSSQKSVSSPSSLLSLFLPFFLPRGGEEWKFISNYLLVELQEKKNVDDD